MGFDTDRPPLPAPTESSTLDSADESIHLDDIDTNVSTNVSNRTDRTSYSVPDDGTPITINTTTPTKPHGGGTLRKKYPSQTSLLIEYFDVGTSEGHDQRRSSVRVRVTPSSRKSNKSSAIDRIQISQATRNHRKPSSTRRISLGSKSRDELIDTRSVDFSDISSLPPGDIELLPSFTDQDSDGGRFIPVPSDISSMPTDSMTGATEILPPARRRSRSLERDAVTDTLVSEAIKDTLKAPREHRSRSLSKDRITQRVMEKLQQQAAEGNLSKPKERSSKSRETSRRRDDDLSSPRKSHRRRSSRDVERTGGVSGTDSSVLSSNIDRRSGVSGTSSINNPKLLATVEDAIKRLILPELNALKEENRTSRNLDKFDRSNRDSTTLYEPAESTSSREPKRRVSKSSSAPKLHSNKPKVVLNKDGEDVPITITGASSRKSDRRSSRSSISSFAESTTREEKSHRRKSKDKEGMSQRESALLGLAGAGLTAAALRHHTSREEKEEERRHRKHRSSRSIRSQSESVSESVQEEEKRPKELVPPLPFNHSELIGGSELTRDSILSADTETKERPQSRSSTSTGITGTGAETPLKQVPRGIASPSPLTPSPLTPSRTPNTLQQNLGSAHSNRSTGDVRQSTPKSERSYTSRAKGSTDAGLSAAAAAAKIRAIEQSQLPTSQYEIESDTQSGRGVSPIQSEASYRGDTNTGSPRRFHSIRSGPSVSSLGDHFERRQSGLSIASLDSTASTKAARTRKRPQGVTLESKKSILNEPSTPTDTKEFFERNHKKNEQYRRELEESPLTPPPVNYNRLTQYTDDSVGGPDLDPKLDQDVRKVGSIPEYIHTPLAVESAVASLYDQTELSVRSSKMSSPVKKSTLSQVSNNPDYIQTDEVPTGQKWSSVREKAEAFSQARKAENSPKQSIPRENSPRQSIAESENAESINEPPRMHHSALPGGHDDMPEIGYGMDDESDVTTNPSIIQGPIGGGSGYRDRTDELLDMQEERDRTPTSFAKGAHLQRHDQQSPASFDDEHQATVEDDYDHPYPGESQYEQAGYAQSIRTPLSGQTGWKDEGYQSANQPEGYTPQNGKYSKMFDDGYDDEYDAMDLGDAEAFATRAKHDRHVSGNSHGMDSPLYDAATGKGIDHIQSKDIVALMDHLTVRDAQRNARDTEILVTLVRSAAEMRTQLDDLKQFIKVQDNMIMNTTDKRVNLAEQRILGGPRPQPLTPPRVNRNQSEEEIETKKKSVFRRALKGLSAGKGDGDIKHIESMLVQLLSEVEGLKQVNQLNLDQQQARTNSMTSFENRRASGDAGYEPEGRANTASSPNQSGYFSIPSQSRRVQDLHSGYDVVPTTRISTVREESDEEYEERSPGYENTERMTTPTQEAFQEKRASLGTPPQASRTARDSSQSQEDTPKRKHKSNSSSIFGIPKISRWSKTTASTNPESLPRHSGSGDKRPYSTHSVHSRSSSQDDYYDEEPYEQHADDRLRSSTSLAREDQGSIRSVRSPSPLIPEDTPYEMEDPKYQAHRNSLNLQHPQPRPGPTGRHQNNLETQAQIFQPMRLSVGSPDFDQWGSMPSLARNRLSGMSAPHASNLSPISSDGSYSQASEHQAGPPRPPKVMDDGPLVPPPQTLAGFGQTRQMYSSPNEFGSQGALTPLAPIAEVRYSLETDRGHRMTPTASPRASTSSLRTMSDLSAPQRKITGPRPMGSKSPAPSSPLQHSDTVVRRKPIADDEESLESYRSSLDSEIF